MVVSAMEPTIHFIVSRSRNGWAVNLDADRLSEHPCVEQARASAERLAEEARRCGEDASFIDLSRPEP
jgi:hypothetical protein